ncbi:MAG: VOC family protein [Micromonosporaceae bacterium]|nr:VOC family protein [Micromonosporaceae bacterium]
MIGQLANLVLETRDPQALAQFYSELLGKPIARVDRDWVDVGEPQEMLLSFQLAPEYEPPRWPDPASSMQFHLDIWVQDIAEAEAKVLALGATRLPWSSDDEVAQGLRPAGANGFRVYADPAGHPFCLCWD